MPKPTTSAKIDHYLVHHATGLELAEVRKNVATLTPREYQVLRMMGGGASNAGIAEEMGISQRTLDIHRRNLVRKLAAPTLITVALHWVALRIAGEDGNHRGAGTGDE